jgi:hypothetical protein
VVFFNVFKRLVGSFFPNNWPAGGFVARDGVYTLQLRGVDPLLQGNQCSVECVE